MTIPDTTPAAVTVGRHRLEVRELPIPRLSEADGLLRVEASGVCGSDVVSFDAERQTVRVMGHETVGTIAATGRAAASRWGVAEGDRVLLEEYLPCGHCRHCRSSDFRYCLESDTAARPDALRYGTTGLGQAPGLWGGFSRFQYLHERTVMHRVPSGLSSSLATLALPIGNGYEWAVNTGGLSVGEAILIFGPGQQGLGCVIAARAAGASTIIMVGLERDRDRLAVARRLGATETLVAGDDLEAEIGRITGGEGVDVVVDTATGGAREFGVAVRAARKGGRVVMPVRQRRAVDGAPLNLMSQKALSVHGVRGHGFEAIEVALRLIQDRAADLEAMSTMTAGLDRVADAIHATAGRGTRTIHATVLPWSVDSTSETPA